MKRKKRPGFSEAMKQAQEDDERYRRTEERIVYVIFGAILIAMAFLSGLVEIRW